MHHVVSILNSPHIVIHTLLTYMKQTHGHAKHNHAANRHNLLHILQELVDRLDHVSRKYRR